MLVLVLHEVASLDEMQKRTTLALEKYSSLHNIRPNWVQCHWCSLSGGSENCPYCGGEGALSEDTNPDAQWGTWQLGGTFDGVMTNAEIQNQVERFNFFLNTTHVENIPSVIIAQRPKLLLLSGTTTESPKTTWFRTEYELRAFLEARKGLLATLFEVYD